MEPRRFRLKTLNIQCIRKFQLSPQEHVQQRIAKQRVNAPVPANNEEIAEVHELVASEACPRRVAEQNVDPCVSLFMEETMEGFSFHLKSARTCG